MYDTCASEKNLEKAKVIIDVYDSLTGWLNYPFEDGYTPVMVAALNKNYTVVEHFLSKEKINILHKKDDQSLLTILKSQVPPEPAVADAQLKKFIDDVKKIEKNFNSGFVFRKLVVEKFNNNASDRVEILDAHVACGGKADIKLVSDNTLMIYLCAIGKFDDAIELIKRGASLDVTFLDSSHTTDKTIVGLTPKKLALYNIQKGTGTASAVRFLQFLDTLEKKPVYDEVLTAKKTLANGNVFCGSFKDGKPFEGTLTKKVDDKETTVNVRSDDGVSFYLV
jgi:hypothetical protein